MMEGATDGMEGMAVGGKSCCPITVRGERHGPRSQVVAELQILADIIIIVVNYYLFTLHIIATPHLILKTPCCVENLSLFQL
jgi:hypothetical protein